MVPTPIGNLNDMTYRAVTTLQEADIIAAEDTRHSKKLCQVFDIHTPLISYHEHNEQSRGEELLGRLEEGAHIALITDAGTPGISDPGAVIASRAAEAGFTVTALPGASASVTALSASGLPSDTFAFIGFVERKKQKRLEELQRWKQTPATLLFYESPHRTAVLVQAALDVFGNRRAVVVRELTKQHETFLRGTLEELASSLEGVTLKGECMLLVEGASAADMGSETTWWQELTMKEHVEALVAEGESSKEAVKTAAKERGVPKRDVYQAYHVEDGE
ncbi:16S rRNA (cytidine(1402)-2'-O)-methyltransferase [Alkalicoccus chagannorensis]